MFHVEHEADLEKLLIHSADQLGIALTGDQCAQFMRYLSQLMYWNRTINLTSITSPREIVAKHFIDSLISLATIPVPHQAQLIDVGTGAGFPGIPLKIVRSDLRVTLIEPNKKKCSFLSSLIGTLRLADVKVFAGTVQEYQDHGGVHAHFITARALRVDDIHSELLSLALPTGKIVLYRTEPLTLRDAPATFAIEQQRKFDLPEDAGERVITVLSAK
ncbi:MAG: putative Ribosomal RNA small subunit methyltransferase G [Nitrospira sp.]